VTLPPFSTTQRDDDLLFAVDDIPSQCDLPCSFGGGPCRNIETAECQAYRPNIKCANVSTFCTCAAGFEDCTDVPERFADGKIYAGSCDACALQSWGNCKLKLPGGDNTGSVCFGYVDDDNMECNQKHEKCTRSLRTEESEELEDCAETYEAESIDPYRECPSALCKFGTSGFW
jgi:hypothetical protein